MLTGHATPEGTARFSQQLPDVAPDDFRPFEGLRVSSIGFGTYLGEADAATDALYAEALEAAIDQGCNVIDTAINYRCQRSERVIGATLEALVAARRVAREAVLLCTKGGYLAFDGSVPVDPARYVLDTILAPGLATAEELVGGWHCLAPAYLDRMLAASHANLRAQTIDVYYLHNPEEQLNVVDRETVRQRIRAAFEWLEHQVASRALRWYGVATWNGFRVHPTAKAFLSLEELVGLAETVAGSSHHCRVIQLPHNLAMPEAFAFKNQMVRGERLTLLEAAARLGVCVIGSASLLQQRLASLAPSWDARIPGLSTAAQRAVQFARSTPGITTALVGMKTRGHVEENFAVARHPCLPEAAIRRLFERPPP